MKALVAVAVLAASSAAAAAWREKDEAKEPAQLFTLEVEGKRTPVELDAPFELPTKGGPIRGILRSEPHRVFEAAGVRFRYPRDMGFEADFEDPPVRLWTLDGNDAVLMVQHNGEEGDPAVARASMADAMAAQYGRALVKREETRLSIGGRELAGATLRVSVAGARLHQSICAFKAGRGTIVLILQDSPKDDGTDSEEFARLLGMLRTTFEFPADAR